MNPAQHPGVAVSHQNHRATVSFRSEVDAQSISALVETLRELIDILQYTRIDIHILSRGGRVSALKYYINAMLFWRDRRKEVKFTTRALADVASASAVMLSLGNERTASLQSRLLYHHARLDPAPTPLTAEGAAEIRKELDRYDNEIVSLLARRALEIGSKEDNTPSWKDRWSHSPPTTTYTASGLSSSLPVLSPDSAFSSKTPKAFRRKVPNDTQWRIMWDSGKDKSERLEFIEKVYRDVFKVDRPIPPGLARRIGLIDHVLDEFDHQKPIPKDPTRPEDLGLTVPHWDTIFPDGHIERDDLTRHFMILGETGSGKSRSGVLPIVDAIVKSSHGFQPVVGCALIIDPKREIAAELKAGQDLLNCDVRIINEKPYALSVMPSDTTVLTLREQAEEILKCCATLVPGHDAQILSGRPPTSREPFWPRQGVALATTAVTLVLWLLMHVRHVHNSSLLKEWRKACLPEPSRPTKETVSSEESEEEQKKPDFPTRYFAQQIDNIIRAAGLMAQPMSTHEARAKRCKELADILLEQHGFFVQQEANGMLWIDEHLPYGISDFFDGFFRWVVGPEKPWTAEVNEVTLGRMFADDLPAVPVRVTHDVPCARDLPVDGVHFPTGFQYRDGDSIVEVDPPRLFYSSDESADHTVYETPTNSLFRRRLTVPKVLRNPDCPTETETRQVLLQLKQELAELGRVAKVTAIERQFELQLKEEDYKFHEPYHQRQGGSGSYPPDALLFLSVIRDAVTGPFGFRPSDERIEECEEAIIEHGWLYHGVPDDLLSEDDRKRAMDDAWQEDEQARKSPFQFHDTAIEDPTEAAKGYDRTTPLLTYQTVHLHDHESDDHESDDHESDDHESDDHESDDHESDDHESDDHESDDHESDDHESDDHESDDHESDDHESDDHESDGTHIDGTHIDDHRGRYWYGDHSSAIRHAVDILMRFRARLIVIRRYGVALCNAMDDKLNGRSGEQEWNRRIKMKVANRGQIMKEMVLKYRELAADANDGLHSPLPRLGFRSPGFHHQIDTELARANRRRGDSDRSLLDSPRRNGLNVIALAHKLLNLTMDKFGIPKWEKLLEGMREGELLNDDDTQALLDDVGTWGREVEAGRSDGTRLYQSIKVSAEPCFQDFSRPSISRVLYFGCEPAWNVRQTRGSGDVVDFEEFISGKGGRTEFIRGERGRTTIFVFQPDLSGSDISARALKARFFASVLKSESRRKPGHKEPLVAYVADEFHRFVTSDVSHGEQSFLDTCRSFGVFCVLASQSRSSISYALRQLGADHGTVEDAISILSNNTGNKLFFRTTDLPTMDWAGRLTPSMPSGQSAATLRPLSSLQRGECFAVLVNGTAKRAQLDWLPPSGKKRG